MLHDQESVLKEEKRVKRFVSVLMPLAPHQFQHPQGPGRDGLEDGSDLKKSDGPDLDAFAVVSNLVIG